MPDRLGELRLDGGALLGLGLLLRLEGRLHLLDVPVQASGDGFHRLGGFLLEGLLAGLEGCLVLEGQRGPGRIDGLLLAFLELGDGLLVAGLDFVHGPFVLGLFTFSERLRGP